MPIIEFEGGVGAGKSTQARLLTHCFKVAGLPVHATHSPGGPPVSEAIRTFLLNENTCLAAEDKLAPAQQLHLFLAAHLCQWKSDIAPRLRAGDWVVADRFILSCYPYMQANGLPLAFIEQQLRLLFGTFNPDMEILLDIPANLGAKMVKLRNRKQDRGFDDKSVPYHNKVRSFYQIMAKKRKMHVIDVSQQSLIWVHGAVVHAVNRHFNLSLHPLSSQEEIEKVLAAPA